MLAQKAHAQIVVVHAERRAKNHTLKLRPEAMRLNPLNTLVRREDWDFANCI